MFQIGSKFVGKDGSKDIWIVVEVVPESKSYIGQRADGLKRLFAKDQMVAVGNSAGHRFGSF